MAEFSDEYIELCRELALPRKWREGDWVYRLVDDKLFCLGNGDAEKMMQWASAHLSASWLLQEGDWLEKFREERIPLTLRLMYDEHGEPFWFGMAPHPMGLNEQQQGDDPALVLCRLYVAVKENAPPAAPSQEEGPHD